MGYRSDSIAISRDMGPLRFWVVFLGCCLNTKEWKIRVGPTRATEKRLAGLKQNMPKDPSGLWSWEPPTAPRTPKKSKFDTEYDRANVPPYNGNDPPPAPGSLKRSLFPTLLNEVQNKGTQGVRARYGAELPPFISIVRYPGRPVISVPEKWLKSD